MGVSKPPRKRRSSRSKEDKARNSPPTLKYLRDVFAPIEHFYYSLTSDGVLEVDGYLVMLGWDGEFMDADSSLIGYKDCILKIAKDANKTIDLTSFDILREELTSEVGVSKEAVIAFRLSLDECYTLFKNTTMGIISRSMTEYQIYITVKQSGLTYDDLSASNCTTS